MNPILYGRMRKRVSKTTPKWQPDGEFKWQDVEIPCPDNKPGCIVVHYGKRMVWVPKAKASEDINLLNKQSLRFWCGESKYPTMGATIKINKIERTPNPLWQ